MNRPPTPMDQAQLVVSLVLTAMRYNFSTTVDPERPVRLWNLALREPNFDADVAMHIVLADGAYSVATLIRYSGDSPCELYWDLAAAVPFVRIERDPDGGGQMWIRFDAPVDPTPPHLLQETIRRGIEAVFAGAKRLVSLFPQTVALTPLRPSLPPLPLQEESPPDPGIATTPAA